MKKVIVLVSAIVVVAGLIFVFSGKPVEEAPIVSAPKQVVTEAPTSTFTMAQVANHADSTSCYSVIRDEVYDLTSAITTHPGGAEKILAICGRDGSNAFVKKHGGSPRQENELIKLRIGVLAK
jgi:cytochrome b involved in lipid metabolism